MIKTQNNVILALLDTKIHSSKVSKFLGTTGYTDMLAVEPAGFVGGLWLLWDIKRVCIEPLDMCD